MIATALALAVFGVPSARADGEVDSFYDGETDMNISRPVTGTYGLETGAISALSTYLSPLTYKGTSYGIYGDWSKAMPFSPENAVMDFSFSSSMGRMENPAHTALMLDLDIDLHWGMAWRKRLPYRLQFTAGGASGIQGGMLWLPRNSNNPVAARAYADVSLTVGISWHTRIGRLPILIADNARMPIAGCFFSPGYGETYYEIYLGNHNGLAHFGWPGNHFTLSNLLSISLDFGRTAMEVGYRFQADTSWKNHINTHLFRHLFVIGVIPGGLGLKKKCNVNSARY